MGPRHARFLACWGQSGKPESRDLCIFSPADTAHRDMQMISALHGRIMEQGLVMAYADSLFLFGVALFLCMGTVLLLRRADPDTAVSMAH